MKEIKKRFEFIKCYGFSMRYLSLWWKFLNGDDKALEEIEYLREHSNTPARNPNHGEWSPTDEIVKVSGEGKS